jgi:hypothetical protein
LGLVDRPRIDRLIVRVIRRAHDATRLNRPSARPP